MPGLYLNAARLSISPRVELNISKKMHFVIVLFYKVFSQYSVYSK